MPIVDDAETLARIETRPGVLDGKPVIRGTRLSVEHVMNLLAHGDTPDSILQEYQGLTGDDIRACLLFAKRAVGDLSFVPLTAS